MFGILRRIFGARPAPKPEPPTNKHLWTIGIYAGASPFALRPPAAFQNPVITRDQVTDIPAAFVADPFLIHSGGIWHLFFEAYDRRTSLGVIALATSPDLASWKYEQVVLAEDFHLSYPHVFEWQGEHYMIPESHKVEAVRLYKATEFPRRWQLAQTLVSGRKFADSTLFQHNNRWWMFTETSPDRKHHTLRLYSADGLTGDWVEHPASPVVENNPRIARPAGPVLKTTDGLFRFAQDCEGSYGKSVRVLKINVLTESAYEEIEINAAPYLTGTGEGWNANGMHHVSAHELPDHSWVAAVDGWRAVTAATIRGE